MSSSVCELVCERYVELLKQTAPPDAAWLEVTLKKLDTNGSFTDIDYTDQSRSTWKPREHLSRLNAMARAYSFANNSFGKSPELLRAISVGLEYWLQHRYQCVNWWFNRIGVPDEVQVIAALLRHDLSAELFEGVLSILDQGGAVDMTAANLLWVADIALHRTALRGQQAEMDAVLQRVWKEVTCAAPEGIQSDGSYYQHGHRLQSHQYGEAFISVIIQIAWQVRDTPLQMPRAKQSIITNYLCDGLVWMSRGPAVTPATIDRAVSRPGALRDNWYAKLKMWIQSNPHSSQPQLERTLRVLQDPKASSVGCKYFPYGDLMVMRTPGWSCFIKTISPQTEQTESINKENLKGVPYLHYGNHFLLQDGNEYLDTPPVWDWTMLPGLTRLSSSSVAVKPKRVVGVTDGRNGIVSMPYTRRQGIVQWQYSKSWFVTPEAVIGMAAPANATTANIMAETCLEQCRQQGDVYVCRQGAVSRLAIGQHAEQCDWVWHHDVLYVSHSDGELCVSVQHKQADWRDINAGYQQACEADMVTVWVKHSSRQGCVYSIWPQRPLPKNTKVPEVVILANDADRQAIVMPKVGVMAVFGKAGQLTAQQLTAQQRSAQQQSGRQLSADTACAVICSARKATVAAWSDQKQERIGISVDGKPYRLSTAGHLSAKPSSVWL